MRLIDADTAKANVAKVFIGASEFAQDTRNAAYEAIDAAPTIEPPVVHGKWVVDECDTTDDVPSFAWINFHCSVCDMDYGLYEGQYGWCRDEEIPYHFCPNCGAIMGA